MSIIFQIRDASGKHYEFEGLDEDDQSLSMSSPEPMTMPMRIGLSSGGEKWTLPWEPIVSVAGHNIIITRNVAKAQNFGGSIKERWAQADWEITIEGYFMNADGIAYPHGAVEKLKSFCEANDTIDVEHELLQSLGITRMVIEDFDFPFSSGPENQNWVIKAISDRYWQLLVKQ